MDEALKKRAEDYVWEGRKKLRGGQTPMPLEGAEISLFQLLDLAAEYGRLFLSLKAEPHPTELKAAALELVTRGFNAFVTTIHNVTKPPEAPQPVMSGTVEKPAAVAGTLVEPDLEIRSPTATA